MKCTLVLEVIDMFITGTNVSSCTRTYVHIVIINNFLHTYVSADLD